MIHHPPTLTLAAALPLLLIGPCPKSEATAVEATTNDFEVVALDAKIHDGVLSASGIEFRRKAGNSQRMTDARLTFWDDADGDGEIDPDEETLTPFLVGGGGPCDELALKSFRFEVGGAGSKRVNAYRGHVVAEDGTKQGFQGSIGQ